MIVFVCLFDLILKDIDYCLTEIFKEFTDK